jgi:hypothetical protein
MTEPVADRPEMPDGYLGGAPLPWRWAVDQLLDARNYWVTTINANGRPHVRPVWGIWHDDTFQFSTGARHAENIARDPRVTVNLDSGDDCVIVEGTGEATTDPATRLTFVDEYQEKYEYPITLEFVDTLYVVRPSVVLGWLAYDIAPGATLFAATATRWRFNPA